MVILRTAARRIVKRVFREAGYEITKLKKGNDTGESHNESVTHLEISANYELNEEFLNLPEGIIDFPVKRIGLGTSWKGNFSAREAISLLQRARELGVNVFDSADVYGPSNYPDATGFSEECLAQAFGGIYDNLLVVTKGGLIRTGPDRATTVNNRSEYLRFACEESLRRLQTERIPLYLLHAVDRAIPIEETAGVLKKLQDEGKIDKVGIGTNRTEIIERAAKEVLVSAVEFEGNHNIEPDESLFNYCQQNKIIMFFLKPLQQGGSIVSDLIWKDGEKISHGRKSCALILDLMNRSPFTIPIPCTRNIFHLAENISALRITGASSVREIVLGQEISAEPDPSSHLTCDNVENEIYSHISGYGCAHVENVIDAVRLERLKSLVLAAKDELQSSLNNEFQPEHFDHYVKNSGRASIPLVHYPEMSDVSAFGTN